MAAGTLYLVPSSLGAEHVGAQVPAATLDALRAIRHFVAENPKAARAFLKAAGHPAPLRELHIATLDEHTPHARIGELLGPLRAGHDCGLLSDAGCPAVADPGAALVRACHDEHIRVVPLVGPSALLLGLMASGMNGQRFSFCGYLPADREARARRLLELEAESQRHDATQLFIEAPYRNAALYETILETCRPDTLLCLATDLTLASESVQTQSVGAWKRAHVEIDRRPTVFLLYRPNQNR